MIVRAHKCTQIQTKILQKRTWWPQSPNQICLYSTSGTLFLLFVQQTCQNIARTIKICSISLVHQMNGWAIPQDH